MERELGSFFSSLSDENRLRIIRMLWKEPRTVTELSHELGMSISATSHQLAKLRQVEVVDCKKCGKQRLYSLKMVPIMCVMYCLMHRDQEVCPHGVPWAECSKLKEEFP